MDLEDAESMEKALALTGTELKGSSITVTKVAQKQVAASKSKDTKKVEKMAVKAAKEAPKGRLCYYIDLR